MSLGSSKDVINKTCLEIIYLIYMYKRDLVLNGWYPIKPNQPNQPTNECIENTLLMWARE